MLDVIRILLPLQIFITLLNILLTSFSSGHFEYQEPLLDFLPSLLINLGLASSIIYLNFSLTHHINRQKYFGKHYTRILLPSFLFILIADIFFTIVSLFQEGLFRGWLSEETR